MHALGNPPAHVSSPCCGPSTLLSRCARHTLRRPPLSQGRCHSGLLSVLRPRRPITAQWPPPPWPLRFCSACAFIEIKKKASTTPCQHPSPLSPSLHPDPRQRLCAFQEHAPFERPALNSQRSVGLGRMPGLHACLRIFRCLRSCVLSTLQIWQCHGYVFPKNPLRRRGAGQTRRPP